MVFKREIGAVEEIGRSRLPLKETAGVGVVGEYRWRENDEKREIERAREKGEIEREEQEWCRWCFGGLGCGVWAVAVAVAGVVAGATVRVWDITAEKDKLDETDFIDLLQLAAETRDDNENPFFDWVRPAYLDDDERNLDPQIASHARDMGINVEQVIREEVGVDRGVTVSNSSDDQHTSDGNSGGKDDGDEGDEGEGWDAGATSWDVRVGGWDDGATSWDVRVGGWDAGATC
ncbi:hypothetical protein Dsin_030133 [Dipteronia sinensis]|uniref:Uncharacterized protein n=1 Tax=Dipteronia sinensis TaxID=43782 RepID=A0AAD9ZIH1_9ROSI|nr:hypothetical protein Dsin_030133 [Dipteronia sinensis]